MTSTTSDAAPTGAERQSGLRARGARLALAVAASLFAITGIVAGTAAPASASTCYDVAKRHASYNVLGQVTHGVTNEIYFCVSSGKISYTQTRASHQESYLWNWVDWNGNFKQGGVGSTYFTYFIQGDFKECAAYCFNTANDWVKITVYSNGTYVSSGG